MSFKELNFNHSYVSCGDNNIADSFIVPALKQTKMYRRSVGFFSSSVFEPIIDGLVSLLRNNGKIQLVVSPHLSADDMEAIELGYRKREEIISDAFGRDFCETINELDDYKLELLANLIAYGNLDIKIAVTKGIGIYHDKMGILEDFEGNIIVFYGSSNSTYSGYRTNYEKIRLINNWTPTELERIDDECAEFDSLWNGTNSYVEVCDYTTSAKNNLIKILDTRKKEKTREESNGYKLREYQEEAIKKWVNNGYRGFYVMATGTGKTLTAIYSAVELMKEHPALVVICAPYKHLVRQWAEDVIKVFPKSSTIMVSSENHDWEKQMTQAIVRQRIDEDHKVIIISTISSFALDRFKKVLDKSRQEKLLIVDEAHRFTNRSEELKEQFNYMLGLSATPFSGKNTVKGEELMSFFGGQVYSLPIEKALADGHLVKYYYHPIFVNATEQEEDRFRKKSSQVASCFRNNVCIDPDNLVKHLRARLRIISMAEEKREKIREILENVQEKDHFIVYCGDGRVYDDNNEEIRHIQFVKRELAKLGFKSSQFTATENMDERMELVDAFNEGAIDALAAIRCLDEGINIPSIKGALILSSNDDYREFVQRRGRILRKYRDKKFANIYDVIVLSPGNEKMAEIEFRRFYEYSRLAINANELLEQLESLSAEYGLNIDDFISSYDEIKEAELDE